MSQQEIAEAINIAINELNKNQKRGIDGKMITNVLMLAMLAINGFVATMVWDNSITIASNTATLQSLNVADRFTGKQGVALEAKVTDNGKDIKHLNKHVGKFKTHVALSEVAHKRFNTYIDLNLK